MSDLNMCKSLCLLGFYYKCMTLVLNIVSFYLKIIYFCCMGEKHGFAVKKD